MIEEGHRIVNLPWYVILAFCFFIGLLLLLTLIWLRQQVHSSPRERGVVDGRGVDWEAPEGWDDDEDDEEDEGYGDPSSSF